MGAAVAVPGVPPTWGKSRGSREHSAWFVRLETWQCRAIKKKKRESNCSFHKRCPGCLSDVGDLIQVCVECVCCHINPLMSDNLRKADANVVTQQRFTFCFSPFSGNTALLSTANSRSASFMPNILLSNLNEGRAVLHFHREQHAWSLSQGPGGETSAPSMKLFRQIIAATALGCIY